MIHLVALPHTQVSQEFCGCAYTGKILKFCKMMSGYDIHVYAPEGPNIEGATLHPCLTNDERIEIFMEDDPNRLPSWPTDEQSAKFNSNVIEALKQNLRAQDLILLS